MTFIPSPHANLTVVFYWSIYHHTQVYFDEVVAWAVEEVPGGALALPVTTRGIVTRNLYSGPMLNKDGESMWCGLRSTPNSPIRTNRGVFSSIEEFYRAGDDLHRKAIHKEGTAHEEVADLMKRWQPGLQLAVVRF